MTGREKFRWVAGRVTGREKFRWVVGRVTGREKFRWVVGRVTGREWFWWVAGIVVVAAVGSVLTWLFWEELRDGSVRNAALMVGGVVTVLLAVWRSVVAERRAEVAHRQVATAQQGLLNERYQKAAGMLGSSVLSVRLGGVYALQRLAEEHPDQYHIQITRLLCAFARNPHQRRQHRNRGAGTRGENARFPPR